MKKTLLVGALLIAGIVSAFPFRTSCGMVFQINNDYAAGVTREALTSTLSALNFNACGSFPSSIVYY